MLNPEIFRQYDIRGIAGKDMTEEDVKLLGRGIGSYLVGQGNSYIAVGRDCRETGESYSKQLIEGLMQFGEQEPPPGSVALLVFQMDADPNEFIVVAVAESEEAYRASAESPEQHERFLEMMRYLAAEPEWNDGQVVTYVTA